MAQMVPERVGELTLRLKLLEILQSVPRMPVGMP